MRRAILLAGVLLLAACGADGLTVTNAATTPTTSHMAETAELGEVHCESDERGAVASGTLRNKSEDNTWAFEIVMEWRDQEDKFYVGDSTRTADLPPGGTAVWEVVPDTPEMPRGNCGVVDVVQLVPGGEATAFPTDGSPTSAPPISVQPQTTYPVPPDGN